jgi:peptide deformylase
MVEGMSELLESGIPKALELRYWDDPVLQTKCPKVEDNEFGPKLEQFGRDLVETMVKNRGVGLAAPQVGVLKRVFAMSFENEAPPIVVCNPVLTLSGSTVYGQEGCLSLPHVFEQVARAANVTMLYSDPSGKMYEALLMNLDARVAQHEDDHLNGIMFFDYKDKRPVYGARMSKQVHKQVMKAWDKEKTRLGL